MRSELMDDLNARLYCLLAEHYGFTTFRPLQLEAINAVLNQRDVVLILPTGGGKSLTFQLPPLVHGQLTVVITPLLALAKDQVEAANDHNIEAALWCGSLTSSATRDSLARDILDESGPLRLLYTTPESIQSSRLLDLLKTAHESSKRICCVAIDEAHACVSWGREFRQSYLSLGSTLAKSFRGVPLLAVTASATPTMRQEIINILHLKDPHLLMGSCNRPELEFRVRFKELMGDGSERAVIEEAIAFVKQRTVMDSGIVYCRLRKTCEAVADAFVSAGIDAAAYHAGLDHSKRHRAQQEWKEGAIQVVVATVAFGMGVDKSDVRWVLHMDPPTSLEGLYQEAGRGGRDGQPACCVVCTSRQDLKLMAKFTASKAAGMAAYVYENRCRRAMLLEHFGELGMKCDASGRGDMLCDVCSDPQSVAQALNKLQPIDASAGKGRPMGPGRSVECDENNVLRVGRNNMSRSSMFPLTTAANAGAYHAQGTCTIKEKNSIETGLKSDCRATARHLRHALHATTTTTSLGQKSMKTVSNASVKCSLRETTDTYPLLKRKLPFKPPRPKSARDVE